MCEAIEDGGRRCERVDRHGHPEATWNADRRAARVRDRLGDARLPEGYQEGRIADRAELVATVTDPAVLVTAAGDTTAVRLAVIENPATPDAVLDQLADDDDQPRAVRRAVRKALRERRKSEAHAGQDAVFRPALTVEPEPVLAPDAELLHHIELSRDPAYREVLQALVDARGEAEDRAEARRVARERREARARAPLTAWLRAVRAGETQLDRAEWEATAEGQAGVAAVLAELDAA